MLCDNCNADAKEMENKHTPLCSRLAKDTNIELKVFKCIRVSYFDNPLQLKTIAIAFGNQF